MRMQVLGVVAHAEVLPASNVCLTCTGMQPLLAITTTTTTTLLAAQVIKSMLQLNQSIQGTIGGVNRYIDSWRRHQNLWKTDKGSVMDKFKAHEPSMAMFEEKLNKYSKVRGGGCGEGKGVGKCKVHETKFGGKCTHACARMYAHIHTHKPTHTHTHTHAHNHNHTHTHAHTHPCAPPPAQMAQDIAALPKDQEQDFIRVSCHALTASVEEEALGWVRSISAAMLDLDSATLQQLKDKISRCVGGGGGRGAHDKD